MATGTGLIPHELIPFGGHHEHSDIRQCLRTTKACHKDAISLNKLGYHFHQETCNERKIV